MEVGIQAYKMLTTPDLPIKFPSSNPTRVVEREPPNIILLIIS
jgi:hypothetical protein